MIDVAPGETLAAAMLRIYGMGHAERHRLCRMVTHVTYRPGRGKGRRIVGRWRRYGAPPPRRERGDGDE